MLVLKKVIVVESTSVFGAVYSVMAQGYNEEVKKFAKETLYQEYDGIFKCCLWNAIESLKSKDQVILIKMICLNHYRIELFEN